jgi:dTDP-4-amino-4,6-dideoxygalactose transaminase
MNIPFVDLKLQHKALEKELNRELDSVFRKGNFILGEQCALFETAFCDYLGGGYGVGVNSGTDALYLSLMAEGIGPGDEVITVSHTFMATYIAIAQTGATAVFIDIDRETFNIDPDLIEGAITPKTKAILPVHLYGRPVPCLRSLKSQKDTS